MENGNWQAWRRFFEQRAGRPAPGPAPDERYADLPPSLARSLAIFQLGESGGGTIIGQAATSTLPGIDGHYADALRLFVSEEHRHAEMLAACVEQLGGRLVCENWTARLFVAARRLIGLRTKVLVLLAAEVVGLCYYHLLAAKLPDCGVARILAEMVEDERAHLRFHCGFLRSQTHSAWRRLVFVLAWRAVLLAAGVAVLIDHRTAIRDLGIGKRVVLRRWRLYGRLAEKLVIGGPDLPERLWIGEPAEEMPRMACSSAPRLNLRSVNYSQTRLPLPAE